MQVGTREALKKTTNTLAPACQSTAVYVKNRVSTSEQLEKYGCVSGTLLLGRYSVCPVGFWGHGSGAVCTAGGSRSSVEACSCQTRWGLKGPAHPIACSSAWWSSSSRRGVVEVKCVSVEVTPVVHSPGPCWFEHKGCTWPGFCSGSFTCCCGGGLSASVHAVGCWVVCLISPSALPTCLKLVLLPV